MNYLLSSLAARRVAAAAAGAAVLMLGGCAVTTSVVNPLKATAQSGLMPVAVSVTANTDEISGFSTIKLQRVVAGERRSDLKLVTESLVMEKVAPGMARDTSLFIGALPPGEYEIVELIDRPSNRLLRVSSAGVGTFKVEAGKQTDLGRLIVSRANFSIAYGRSARSVSNIEMIERFAPDYRKLFGAEVIAGWSMPRSARDDVEASARAHPVGMSCVTELADGRVAAASRMGAVMLRSSAGAWRAVNAESSETLSCILPVDLPEAELLAVGEFGTLVRKPRDSDQLVAIDTGNLPPGNLLSIGGNATDGWYVMHRKGNDLGVFHSRQLQAGNWTSVHTFKVPGSMYYRSGFFWQWQDARSMGYALLNGRIAEVDYSTGKWSERSSPRKAKLDSFKHYPDGTESVLIQAGLMGRFPDAFISRDRGRNWTPIVSPFKVLTSTVVPLADGRLLMESGMYNKRELMVSSDEGKTWAPYVDYPRYGAPVRLPSGLMLSFGSTSSVSTIYSSVDDARTWKLEHTNLEIKMPPKTAAR